MSFPLATKQGGGTEGFPDTCKTPAPPGPPMPMPYKSDGKLMQAKPGTCSKKVKVLNQPVITTKTELSMTTGTAPGSAGGVMSGTSMGPAKFKKGSAKVKVEGQPVVFQTCIAGHNGSNANMPAAVHSSASQSNVSVKM